MKLSHNPCRWLLLFLALTQIASAAAPVLTSFSNLSGTEDQALEISFADVDGAANVSNLAAGDPTGYNRISVVNGSLNLNSEGATLTSGETWIWTPPANANGVIQAISLQATNSGGDSLTRTLSVNLSDVNDSPTFTAGNDVTVAEDSGAYSATWATSISSGSNTTYPDAGQNVTFTITSVSDTSAFSAGPAISPTGTLTFTPATDYNTSSPITMTVTLADGITANGSLPTATLSIEITPVNDSPTFTGGGDVTVAEDSGAYSATWATSISSGSNTTYPDAGQNVTFTITSVSDTSAFSAGPAISPTGTLTFTPATDYNTSSPITMTVTLADGITANGSLPTATLSIEITPVNDSPTFTAGSNVTVNEDTSYTSPSAWATAISAGPTDESGQTLSFAVSVPVTDQRFFSVQPAINESGFLTFTPQQNYNTGTPSNPIVLSVELSDNGLPAATSSAQTVNVNITPVNDDPVFGGTMPADTALTNVSIDIGNATDVTVPPTYELPFFSSLSPSDDDVDDDEITITVSVPTTADNLIDVFTPDDASNPATGTVSNPNRVFSKTGTITAVRTWFQGIKFVRDPLVTDRTSADILVKISLTDGKISSPVTQEESFRLNFEPPVDMTIIPSTVVEGNSIRPFNGLAVAGRDAATQTELTLSLADATYASLNGTNSVVLSGALEQINSALSNVEFTGKNVSSDESVDVTVTVAGKDSITKTFTVIAINFPPTITSLPTSAFRVNDDDAVNPLASVSVQDPESLPVTLTLRLLDNTLGSFTLAAGASGTISTVSTVGSITTYTIGAADRGRLVFKPTPDVIELGKSKTVQFEFFGTDSSGNSTTTFTIDILITAVAGAPYIKITDPAYPSEPLKIDPVDPKPFASVDIIDEAGDVEVTITLDDEDKGVLTTLGGFADNGGGVYSFTGTLTAANTALKAMVFEPSLSSGLFAPNEPGRTDFTIEVLDNSGNRATKVIPIVLIGPPKNFLVVNSFDEAGSSILGSLRHAVMHAASGDTITIALETYPATIFLDQPLVITKNVSIRGPGADLFIISGDKDRNGIVGAGDIQIFSVSADLKLQGLTLSGGYADEFGGAISITRDQPSFPAVNVEIRDCVIRDSIAGRFGGAIDNFNGSLLIDRCSFVGNSTTSNGQGGGALSLYTNEDCVITNTTFAQNIQAGAQGFGGAALYVENTDPLNLLLVKLLHCTFSENTDAAAAATSLCAVAGNTLALVANSIFADGADYNLFISGGAEIVSLGGNISDDDTTTLLVRSGNPQQIALFSEETDITSTDPELGFLTQFTGGLYAYPLIGGGAAAIMAANQSNEALDIRSALRLTSANVGALQQDGNLGRILINEILSDPGDESGEQEDFIELYVPRDAGAVDLDGYSLIVDGTLLFEFGTVSINSGLGHIVKRGTTTPSVPTTVESDLDLLIFGTVELRDGSGNTVISESYVADFWNPSALNTPLTLAEDESMTLAPQFFGHAYVPHSLVKTAGYRDGVDMDKTGGRISSEYNDSGGSPIDGSNGAPIGNPDEYTLFEGQVILLDVLANDFDPDGDPLTVTDGNITNATIPNLTITSAGTGIELTVGSVFDSMSVGSKRDLVFTYTPQDDQVSPNLSLNPANVSISVIGRNDSPVAVPDTYTTGESQYLEIYAGGATPSDSLLFNDTDADSDDSSSTLNVAGVVTPISIDSYSANGTSGNVDANITDHGLNEGDVIKIYDFEALYSGLQTVVSVINANTVELDIVYDPSATPDDHWHLVQRATSVSAYSEAISGLLRATLPTHGLSTGDFITITGASTSSYNESHAVTVVDANTVDLYVAYVDASASLGQWTLDGAFDPSVITNSTMSAYGAEVEFFLRQIRAETFVGYDPDVSPSLNALALTESVTDRFFYAVEDSHGAVFVSEILITVNGENDAPNLQDDPGELESLKTFSVVSGYSDSAGTAAATLPAHGLLTGDAIIIQGYLGDSSYNAMHSVTLIDENTVNLNITFVDALLPAGEWRPVDQVQDFLAAARVVYAVVGSVPNTINTRIENSEGVGLVMIDTPSTTQEQSITISGLVLLENDSDPDTSDVLNIVSSLPSATSRLGAGLTLQDSNVTYVPSDSSILQNLPRSGSMVDSFEVTVTDGTVSGKTTVAVVVFGDNDMPEASDESYTFTENDFSKVDGGMIGDGTISIDVTNTGLVRNATDDDQTQSGILYAVPSASQTLSDGSTATIDYATRTGNITGFAAVAGESGLTRVTSPGHGLSSGDAVFIRAVPSLDGYFIVTVENDDQFTIDLAHDVSYNLLIGLWFYHQGTLFIDSVVDFDSLALGETLEYTYDYSTTDGSLLFATDDLLLVNTDSGTHTLDVLANDFNFNALQSDFLIIGVELPSEGGIADITEDGLALEYSPAAGFVGTEVIFYTIQDSYGNIDRANALVRVTTEAINGRIFANSDVFSVSKGAISAVELDVLANDVVLPSTSADEGLQITSIDDAGVDGGLSFDGNVISYVPDSASIKITETFTYTVSGGGSVSEEIDVTLNIVDNTLSLIGDVFHIPTDSGSVSLDVLANDVILPDSADALTIQILNQVPTNGLATILDGGGAIQYTPNAGFIGRATLAYNVIDANGATGTSLVTINVGYLVANPDFYSLPIGQIFEFDVLANDVLIPGNATGLSLNGVRLGGSSDSFVPSGTFGELTVEVTSEQKLKVTSSASWSGELSLEYKVQAGLESFNVLVSFSATSAPIRASGDLFEVLAESTEVSLDVADNDYALDEVALGTPVKVPSIISVTTPDRGGIATIDSSNNVILYTPSVGFTGVETFDYTISNGVSINVARSTVTVSEGKLFANNDGYQIFFGSVDNELPVLSNDLLLPNDDGALEIVSIDTMPAADGTVALSSDGASITYNPPATLPGAVVTFGYEISDGSSRRARAIVTLDVSNRSDTLSSETNDDYFRVSRNASSILLPILLNDNVKPASAADWIITSIDSQGTSVVTAPGGQAVATADGIVYTAPIDFSGTETFAYTVSNSLGGTGDGLITVRVGDLRLVDDIFTLSNEAVPVSLDVLANDGIFKGSAVADAFIKSINAASVSSGTGLVSIGPKDDTLIYTPDGSSTGQVTLTYTVDDATGNEETASVLINLFDSVSDRDSASLRVTVTGVNDVPVLGGTEDDGITDKETVFPFDTVTLSDLDESGDQEQIATVTFDASHGAITSTGMTELSPGESQVVGTPAQVVAALRAIEFTPFENLEPPSYYNVDFTLTITDGYIPTPIVDVTTVTVLAINDAPDPVDDSAATTPENQVIRFLADATLLPPVPFDFGDLDPDFQAVNGTGGTVTLLPVLQTPNLLANDIDVDIDDDETTIELINVHQTDVGVDQITATSALGATVVLDIRALRAETNILYDPRGSATLNALPAGESLVDSFYYTVIDQHGAKGIAKVSIIVNGVNDVPTAQNDGGYEVGEDGTILLGADDILSNDTDPDQGSGIDPVDDDDAPIISNVPATSDLGANLTWNLGDDDITYDPTGVGVFEALSRNEFIEDSITYTISDENGGTSMATIALEIEGFNDAPIAADDLLETLENDMHSFNRATGLLSNDVEIDINNSTPDDDHWVIPQREVTTPLGAALHIETDGSYSYDANSRLIDSLIEDEPAVETFPYIVTDNFRTSTAPDTFKVLADSTNVLLPVLSNDDVAGSVPVAVLGYTEDLADTDRVIIESANHELRDGLLVKIQSYAGTGAYNGVFAITVVDRDYFSVESPYADDPAGTRGTWRPWFNITALGETDQEGVVTISTDAQTILYTPKPGFYGSESFQYTIEDGVGGQDVTDVAITVLQDPLNNVLSVSDDRFQIGKGESAVEVDVLVNDNVLPESGSAYIITGVAPDSATGAVSIINGGTGLSYTPLDTNFTGVDTFTYTVSGGGSSSTQATVTFNVIDREDYLDGSDDDFVVVQDSSANLLDVAANDASLPSFPVSFEVVAVSTPSAGGAASVDNGQVSYTPLASYTGLDSFTYTIRDASGGNITKTVDVQVVSNADDFYALDDHYIIVAGSGEYDLAVMFNDAATGANSSNLSIVNLGLDTQAPPAVERVAFIPGLVKYTVPATVPVGGKEVFNYEITDGTDQRREAVITVTIVDALPTLANALDDNYHVAKNASAHSLDVTLNDLPLPSAGWAWTITSATAASQGGSVIVDGGTAITYSPAAGFYGVESFDYTIEDVFGDSSSATVTVAVGVQLTEPDSSVVLENSSLNDFPVLQNDDLLERFAADYTISAVGTPDQAGVVVIDGSGPNNQLLYTPAEDFVGEETFTYTVIDKTGGTAVETVTVEVIAEESDRDFAQLRVEITGVNDTPQLTGIANGATTDKLSVKPFPTVSIIDLDEWAGDLNKWGGEQLQNITVEYDEAYGTVVTPGMIRTSQGVYQMTGTPASVTAALNAIVFTPYENFIDYIDPGFFALDFDLSIDDTYLLGQVNDTATIVITPIDDVPTITDPIADMVLQVNAFPRVVQLGLHFADVDDDIATGQIVWTVSDYTNPSLFNSVTVDEVKQQLVLDFAIDQFGVAEITVRGTDRGGLYVEDTFRVTVDGPPVIELAAGETQPTTANYVQGSQSGFRRDYRQSFRVTNEGVLTAAAFILHITELNVPVEGVTVFSGTYSTDENGSPNDFNDDTRSSDGVTLLRKGTYYYALKYDFPLEPGESVVVHVTYRVATVDVVPIRPNIRVELTSATPLLPIGTSVMVISNPMTGEPTITFMVQSGVSYQMQYSSNLTNWFPWSLIIPVSDFDREITITDDGLYTDTHPSLILQRFYRLVEISIP